VCWAGVLGAMPTLVVGMLAVSLRSLGKHGTRQSKFDEAPVVVTSDFSLSHLPLLHRPHLAANGSTLTNMGNSRTAPTTVTWRLRSLLWYSSRPKLYRQFVRRVKARFFHRDLSPGTREAAERWCEERSMDTAEAILKITGSPMVEPVRDRFKDVFVKAEEVERTCPVKMGGAAGLDLLYWVAERLQAQHVVETGVAYGWSSLVLLLSLAKRDRGLLISTDMPYANRNNDKYVGCVVPAELRSRWQIIDRADRDALPRALRTLPSLDMCHYDSDKSYEGRMWAYPRLWNSLRPGGCFVSDDVSDNLAFRDFCRRIDANPIVVRMSDKYAGVLINRP